MPGLPLGASLVCFLSNPETGSQTSSSEPMQGFELTWDDFVPVAIA